MNKRFASVLLILLLPWAVSFAQPFQFSVKNMVAQADNIFIGTVDKISFFRNDKGFPLTRVVFKNVQGARSLTGSFEVQFAGGQIGDTVVTLTHTPEFNKGEQYLVFAADPSKGFANPAMGRYGILKVIADKENGGQYLATMSNHCLVAINEGEMVMSGKQLVDVADGVPEYLNQPNKFKMDILPKSSLGKNARLLTISKEIQMPMTLNDFRAYLNKNYNLAFTTVDANLLGNTGPDSFPQKITSSVSACGSQTVFITMKQLPDSVKPWYGINQQCLSIWNQTMDIYRTTPSTGTFGQNDTSEFGGFPSDLSMQNAYGFGFYWGPGAIAVTVYFWSGACTKIREADVFVNPSVPMTDNVWDQVNGMAVMYRCAIIHELGHVWGLMDGVQETYDYDVPTVMQGGTPGIYEDGAGIHCPDAFLMRYQYVGQTPVIKNIDLGIESYYPMAGLLKSTLDATSLNTGDVLNVHGLTVENISPDTVFNVQVQFYLSKDSIITENDYLVPDLYTWGFFYPSSFLALDFQLTIPSEVHSGSYYVGAMIKHNNTADAFKSNNTTVLNDKVNIQNFADAVHTLTGIDNDVAILPTGTRGSYAVIYKGHNKGTVRVFAVTGQKLLEQDLAEKKLQLPDVSGIYLAEVIMENGRKLFKLPNY